MNPEDRRQDAFLQHLGESEQRLGGTRHSVFDALFVGILTLVIVAGFTLGIMRLRTPSRPEPSHGAAAPSVPAPVSAPSAPAVGQPAKDERPYVDASKPGQYTITDSKVQVEINTLSEQERDAKLEQLKKEGLITDKEAEALKKQRRSP